MVNEINIQNQNPVLEILNYLDKGKVSFEQAIGAIRSGSLYIANTDRSEIIIPAALRMDLCNLTPYL